MQSFDRVAVDQGEVRFADPLQRKTHGFPGRLQNVDGIDLLRMDLTNGIQDRGIIHQQFPQLHTLFGRQFLGVIDPLRDPGPVRKDNGGSDHRSGTAAAPGFIHTRHKGVPRSACLLFKVKHGGIGGQERGFCLCALRHNKEKRRCTVRCHGVSVSVELCKNYFAASLPKYFCSLTRAALPILSRR